jgi:hypothetical protein
MLNKKEKERRRERRRIHYDQKLGMRKRERES